MNGGFQVRGFIRVTELCVRVCFFPTEIVHLEAGLLMDMTPDQTSFRVSVLLNFQFSTIPDPRVAALVVRMGLRTVQRSGKTACIVDVWNNLIPGADQN